MKEFSNALADLNPTSRTGSNKIYLDLLYCVVKTKGKSMSANPIKTLCGCNCSLAFIFGTVSATSVMKISQAFIYKLLGHTEEKLKV